MLPLMISLSVATYYNTLRANVSRFPRVSTYVLLIGGVFFMTEPVRFLGRQTRLQSLPTASIGEDCKRICRPRKRTGSVIKNTPPINRKYVETRGNLLTLAIKVFEYGATLNKNIKG